MRTLYFDCFAGASGDMIVGALIDLGVDFEALRQHLTSLDLGGYTLNAARTKRRGIAATKFDVQVDAKSQPARRFADITAIIEKSALSERTRERAIQVFQRLATAEAGVHGTTEDEVHFHEVGAVDSIIDVVGSIIGFEMLGAERFFSSPLRVGRGTVKTEHGLLPIPAPATAELLRGAAVYAGDVEGEFVTPTGAAILATICESFGSMPPLTIDRVGYGAGSRDPDEVPNALRLVLGETASEPGDDDGSRVEAERVMVIETNIDDMNPQVYGFVMERALALGALDLFITPVQMKKDRPGVLLTVLCEPQMLEVMSDLILTETTTLGIRYYETERRVLQRVVEIVETAYGPVKIKVARRGNRTLHFQPEYDDCAGLARDAGVSLIEVQGAASAAYRAVLKARESR
jgi:uncharacterized protein (TIGR00299 family) protein